jgi:hypothetical protein
VRPIPPHDLFRGAQNNPLTITIDDLARSWSRTTGRDLRRWAIQTLIPATRPDAHEQAR